MRIGFFYDFRPVGQGLFSIGRLSRHNGDDEIQHFTWVHDCGSENLTATVFNTEITSLTGILENNDQLDLLILSHFDNDHISGLISLLALCRVRRLVIPYMTPAERLLVLFSTPGASANLQGFLAAPLAFIRAQRGGQETEIMFIDAPPDGSTSLEAGGTFGPNTPSEDIGKKNTSTKEQEEGDPDLAEAARLRPALMKDGATPLIIWGAWEFCFYNLPPDEVNRKADLAKLWNLVEADFRLFHERAKGKLNQAGLIEKMRDVYRQVFGKSDKQRNDISLVTYTGPVKNSLVLQGICSPSLSMLYPSGDSTRPKFCFPRSDDVLLHWFEWTESSEWWTTFSTTKPSMLYTGDITLTDGRVIEIKRLLTDWRWDMIEVFQVPHHGAESSWKISSSALNLFAHRYSVFSSARYRPVYLHPRPEVLDALAHTTRVLVNEYTGAVFHGGAAWKEK